MAVQYYKYRYSGIENIKVDDFLKSEENLFVESITKKEFLEFKGNTIVTNAGRIFDTYNFYEQLDYIDGFVNNTDVPYIKPGTIIILPSAKTQIELALVEGKDLFLEQQNFQTYWSDNLNNLLQSGDYIKKNVISAFRSNGVDIQTINENIKVWIWIRAENKIFDISPLIQSIASQKTFESGNFTIKIDPFTTSNLLTFGQSVINYFNFDKVDTNLSPEGLLRRHVMDFITQKVQKNDLIFIRYEGLEVDPDQKPYSFEVQDKLQGNVWDMIALVDTVNDNYSAPSSKQITISGRDLMKLLIDDGTYFFSLVGIENSDERFFYQGDKKEAYFKRNSDGAFHFFYTKGLKKIKDSLGFILNHLTNVEIVPDNLFDSYANVEIDGEVKDLRSKVYEITTNREDQKTFIETSESKGIWQIIKLFIDKPSEERRVVDNSFVNPDGNILEYFKKVCQEPFVQFWGDTNGDKFDFIVRQPPFTKSQIQDVVNRGDVDRGGSGYITIKNASLLNYNLAWETRSYGWYQIEPQNELLNLSKAAALSYFPVVWLPQFVKTFGNTRLIQRDNYFWADSFAESNLNKPASGNIFARKAVNDLKYLIDAHAYLPFTRTGSITLIGDRRIKVGTFVYLEASNELFYVKSVSNSVSFTNQIIRTTTLQVERGMVFEYILGAPILDDNSQPIQNTKITDPEEIAFREKLIRQQTRGGVTGGIFGETSVANTPTNISYFDIVDTEAIIRDILVRHRVEGVVEPKVTQDLRFGVRENVFNAFLKRRQNG